MMTHWGWCSLLPVSALPCEPHTMPLAGVVSLISPAFKAADNAGPLVDVRLEGFVLYLKYTWKHWTAGSKRLCLIAVPYLNWLSDHWAISTDERTTFFSSP